MGAYRPALASVIVGGLTLTPLLPAGVVGGVVFSAAAAGGPQDPTAYGWRNLAWAVDTVVVRGDAERVDDAPGALGLLVGKRGRATFKLDLPRKCRILRVRVKPNGITLDGGARTKTMLRRTGPKPKTYDPVTTELQDAASRLPDMTGRPAGDSRRFVFRVKDVTPPRGTADYTLGVTFGGWCPK